MNIKVGDILELDPGIDDDVPGKVRLRDIPMGIVGILITVIIVTPCYYVWRLYLLVKKKRKVYI